jgi:hypothetical protein
LESLGAESVTGESETLNKDHPEQEGQQIENQGLVNSTDSPNRTPQENQPQQNVVNNQVFNVIKLLFLVIVGGKKCYPSIFYSSVVVLYNHFSS